MDSESGAQHSTRILGWLSSRWVEVLLCRHVWLCCRWGGGVAVRMGWVVAGIDCRLLVRSSAMCLFHLIGFIASDRTIKNVIVRCSLDCFQFQTLSLWFMRCLLWTLWVMLESRRSITASTYKSKSIWSAVVYCPAHTQRQHSIPGIPAITIPLQST